MQLRNTRALYIKYVYVNLKCHMYVVSTPQHATPSVYDPVLMHMYILPQVMH